MAIIKLFRKKSLLIKNHSIFASRNEKTKYKYVHDDAYAKQRKGTNCIIDIKYKYNEALAKQQGLFLCIPGH